MYFCILLGASSLLAMPMQDINSDIVFTHSHK